MIAMVMVSVVDMVKVHIPFGLIRNKLRLEVSFPPVKVSGLVKGDDLKHGWTLTVE